MAIDGATEMTKKMKQAIEYARRVEFDRGWRAGVDHEYARLNELERLRLLGLAAKYTVDAKKRCLI
jgi:hypothetical protein